jgi:hypothetical protein
MHGRIVLSARRTFWTPLLRLLRGHGRRRGGTGKPPVVTAKPGCAYDAFLQFWAGGGF